MAKSSLNQLKNWYADQRAAYDGLSRIGASILESLLKREGIPFLSVTFRTKTLLSVTEKQKRNRYRNPQNEITDFCGIRVITYIESDIERIVALARSCFDIDSTRSIDKTSQLDTDQFGYRSVHLICGLGLSRTNLPEFYSFAGLVFELQVRTVLQHAWAEIEHDRNYKFSTQLPSQLQRRLYLIAGLLEVADREFNALSSDIDSYAKSVAQATAKGDFNIEISTAGLLAYWNRLSTKFSKASLAPQETSAIANLIVEEIKDFGITSLDQLDSIMTSEIIGDLDVKGRTLPLPGVFRDAMMLRDLDRYFSHAWKDHWQYWEGDIPISLTKKYGEKRIDQVLIEHGITRGADIVDVDDE